MTEPPELPRLALEVALRRYWKHLIGMAVFPIAAFVGIDVFHLPSQAFFPFFFAAMFLGGWPYLARRAPYTFWIIALIVWMAAVESSVLLLQILRLLFDIPKA